MLEACPCQPQRAHSKRVDYSWPPIFLLAAFLRTALHSNHLPLDTALPRVLLGPLHQPVRCLFRACSEWPGCVQLSWQALIQTTPARHVWSRSDEGLSRKSNWHACRDKMLALFSDDIQTFIHTICKIVVSWATRVTDLKTCRWVSLISLSVDNRASYTLLVVIVQ